jgi:phage protein D
MGTVSGSAETMGLPDLRSGKIVTLLGVGDRYEGEYKITDATHSISESGYSTSINVQRNATS